MSELFPLSAEVRAMVMPEIPDCTVVTWPAGRTGPGARRPQDISGGSG
ncbi:hypothetical protein [Streptomyces sp. NPDC057428]